MAQKKKRNTHIFITSIILTLGAVLSALGGVWGNIATNNLPDVIRPLVPYSWSIFGGIVVLIIGVTLWQYLYQEKINNPVSPSSQPSPTQPAVSTPLASASSSPCSPHHSCFICYAHEDQQFADKLYRDLQAKGVQCWYSREDLKVGDEIRQTIDTAIGNHAKLLLILSANSVESDWVRDEVEVAFEEERLQKNKLLLFPIRLDEEVMKTKRAWAAAIRRVRYIGDFTRWQQSEEYEKAFSRLLRDLKA